MLYKVVFSFLAVGGGTYALFQLRETPNWLKAVAVAMAFAALLTAFTEVPHAFEAIRSLLGPSEQVSINSSVASDSHQEELRQMREELHKAQELTAEIRRQREAIAIEQAAPKTETPVPPETKYGAIAISNSTRALGWSYNFTNQADAETDAYNQCRKHASDCSIATSFHNACGAIAFGQGNGWGANWAADRNAAERAALAACARYAGNCSVTRWVCASN